MSEGSQQPQPDPAEGPAETSAPASDERVRPIPVRAVPPTSAAARASFSDRPAPPPAARATVEAPIPAREESRSPPPPPPEPVRIEKDGRRWLARVAGRGVGGHTLGTAARLVLVTFATEEDPDRPLLEALHAGRELGALSDEELEALLAHARPFGRATPPERDEEAPRGGRRGAR